MFENIKEDWERAVRQATGQGMECLQQSILIRGDFYDKAWYLLAESIRGKLKDLISDSEGITENQARQIVSDLYHELYKSAFDDTADFMRVQRSQLHFEPVRSLEIFLADIHPYTQTVRHEAASSAAYRTRSKINRFADKRRREYLERLKDDSDSDEMPDYLDEFEYIDWLITH